MSTLTSSKPWLVQKYGGTSLGKRLDSIHKKIIPSFCKDYNVAIVCSAVSGSTKASGTTSLLLECITLAQAGHGAQIQLLKTIETIRNNHFYILRQNLNITDDGAYQSTCAAISRECDGLQKFLLAAQVIGELSPRTQDRIVALGEKLACFVVAAVLTSSGFPAEAVVLDNIVETAFGTNLRDQKSALERLDSRFYQVLAEEIAKRLCSVTDRIPVVTGFFGIMPDSLLKTVGRGYSDLCAAMCAVGMNAAELQIWKEVDGIFTTDPRKIASARLLSTATPEEAMELTYYGSEVIHPLTMGQVCEANIPLRLKNVFNPKGSGTIIYPSRAHSPPLEALTPCSSAEDAKEPLPPPVSNFMLKNGYHGDKKERRRPTAVTAKDDIMLLNVLCKQNTSSQVSSVLKRLEECSIDAYLVTTSGRNVSLALQAPDAVDSMYDILRSDLETYGKVSVLQDMSIVTVVGHKMRNMVGISAEILSSLAAAKINIYLISQGASEINVSVVVREEEAVKAMEVIHSQVLRIPTHREQENRLIKGPWLY